MKNKTTNLIPLSENYYYDVSQNVIIDTREKKGRRTDITGYQKILVLNTLIKASPNPVTSEELCRILNLDDESRVTRIISDLKKDIKKVKDGLEECIPKCRYGEKCYRFIQYSSPKKQETSEIHPRKIVLEDTHIITKKGFVEEAREDIFKKLDDAFQRSRIVFLVGCGGIGKSEACKHWAKKKKAAGKYDTVVFAPLNSDDENSNVLSLITDDFTFRLTGKFAYQYENESDKDYFTRKLNTIRLITNEKTLLIVDNYDKEDPWMKELLVKGTYHLLITTRNNPKDYDFQIIPVEEIKNVDHLKNIFFGYLDNQRTNIQRDDPYIEKLFGLVWNHTLAIEIIAQFLKFSNDTPETLYQKISDSEDHALIRNMDGYVDDRRPFEIIKMLFNLSHLKKDKNYPRISQVLAFMSAMPTKGIEWDTFYRWTDDGDLRRARAFLVDRRWLREDYINGVRFVSMHPLIREVVWKDLQPSPDKFPTIISKFLQDDNVYIDGLYHEPKEIKAQYEKIMLSLLSAFPVRDLSLFEFYSKIQRTLHFCANPDAALNLAKTMKTILENKNQTDTWEYALVNYQIGVAYATLYRSRDKGIDYLVFAETLMEEKADSNEKNFVLARVYREIASIDCQDRHLFKPHTPSYIGMIEDRLRKGEALVSKLKKDGFTNRNIEIYRGTLCVWYSKLEVYRGNLEVAETLLTEAEENFNKYDYTNTLDKVAVEDIRALIYERKGDYSNELAHLNISNSVFIDGFSEYHYASIERALKIAKAHKNNRDLKSALTVLARCKEILEDMKKKTKEATSETLAKEIFDLLSELS